MNVSVSILKEYDNLKDVISKVNDSCADFLHVDVMDGKFVSNKKFEYKIYKELFKLSKKPLDVHLMVNNIHTVKKYAKLKPDLLTFHCEIIKNDKIIKYLKRKNIKVGLAINPNTDINKLIPYLNNIDLILIMSVNPGLPSQKFISDVLNKVDVLKQFDISSKMLSIDGGVNDSNINLIKKYNFNMVVSGSYITDSNNYNDKINGLR